MYLPIFDYSDMGVSKNRGNPKMDGENNGKPLLRWMIWGENPLFSETSIYAVISIYYEFCIVFSRNL